MAKPRTRTPQGLATFCKGRTAKIRELLREISITYCDVDSYIETHAEELLGRIDDLDRDIDDAVAEGRGAQ